MPRPRKRRNVCFMPERTLYGPLNANNLNSKGIIMTVDEYETIRLMDVEGMSQEECSKRMNVARTTVQRIYTIARNKLARSLVNGDILKIEGGDFSLCSMDEIRNGCGRGRRGRCRQVHINKPKKEFED